MTWTLPLCLSLIARLVLAAVITRRVAGERVFNPDPKGMAQYTLKQQSQDGASEWCMTAQPAANQNDQRQVREDVCQMTTPQQFLNLWEFEPESGIYMFRFTSGGLCLGSDADAEPPATPTTQQATGSVNGVSQPPANVNTAQNTDASVLNAPQ
ncbi:hypothetical protein THASP1DRAFT_26975, partial [Thamnocephalis sphaerospora]